MDENNHDSSAPPSSPAAVRTTLQHLPLDAVTWDYRVQPREQESEAAVARYEERYRRGLEMDPVEAVLEGSTYWGYDGFQRRRAAARAGLEFLSVLVREGTFLEARELARRANLKHKGEPLSLADQRRTLRGAIEDRPTASDRGLGALYGVHYNNVKDRRREMAFDLLVADPALDDAELTRVTGLADPVYLADARALAARKEPPTHSNRPRNPTHPNSHAARKAAAAQAPPAQEAPPAPSVSPEGDEEPADELSRAVDEQRRRAEKRRRLEQAAAPEPIYDLARPTPRLVPESLCDLFASAELPDLSSDLRRLAEGLDVTGMRGRITRLSRVFTSLDNASAGALLLEARRALEAAADLVAHAAPHTLCPDCAGAGRRAGEEGEEGPSSVLCGTCLSRGYLTWSRVATLREQAEGRA